MGNIMKQRTGMESHIQEPLTKDEEAKQFLEQTKSARKKAVEKVTKKAERAAGAISDKVKDDVKGSFTNTLKESIFDQARGLGPSMAAAYGVNAILLSSSGNCGFILSSNCFRNFGKFLSLAF